MFELLKEGNFWRLAAISCGAEKGKVKNYDFLFVYKIYANIFLSQTISIE
jgi:hypothetical protein